MFDPNAQKARTILHEIYGTEFTQQWMYENYRDNEILSDGDRSKQGYYVKDSDRWLDGNRNRLREENQYGGIRAARGIDDRDTHTRWGLERFEF